MATLAALGHGVVAVDLPGYGKSKEVGNNSLSQCFRNKGLINLAESKYFFHFFS